MKFGDIVFLVSRGEKEEGLKIELSINNSYISPIKLYRGKSKIDSIKCEEDFYVDSNFIYIDKKKDSISLEYEVLIGQFSKHGKGGSIEEGLITFMGEQFLLMPVEILAMQDGDILEGKIEIDFRSLRESLSLNYENVNFIRDIIPFRAEIFKSICKEARWTDIYELMKSPYTFGNFKEVSLKEDNKNIKIFYEEKYLNKKEKEDIIKNIFSLCSYYYDLFETNNKEISIVLLRKSEKEFSYILGGCGKNIISATFLRGNKRDWQLLSHRLFHSFMDSILTSRLYHLPPNLWLTEGVATYYENLALNSLEEGIKKNLDIDFNKEMARLYTRYLYMTLKDPKRFNIAPMEEGSIKSHGKMEFLHYTKAPLIVYFIESLNPLFKDNIIKKLLYYRNNIFSLERLFYSIFNKECTYFANQYLFRSTLLPLWDLGRYINEEEIIPVLEEYEYILWTWFSREEEGYLKEEFNYDNYKDKSFIDKEDPIIYNKFIDERISKYSKRLSLIIKAKLYKGENL